MVMHCNYWQTCSQYPLSAFFVNFWLVLLLPCGQKTNCCDHFLTLRLSLTLNLIWQMPDTEHRDHRLTKKKNTEGFSGWHLVSIKPLTVGFVTVLL